jgi:hypothetical protein
LFITPGPKFSTTTSQRAISCFARSRASGFFRFRVMLPFPAQQAWFERLRFGSRIPSAKGGSPRVMSTRARDSIL